MPDIQWVDMKRVMPKIMQLKRRNYLLEKSNLEGRLAVYRTYWNGISFRHLDSKSVFAARHVKRIAMMEDG